MGALSCVLFGYFSGMIGTNAYVLYGWLYHVMYVRGLIRVGRKECQVRNILLYKDQYYYVLVVLSNIQHKAVSTLCENPPTYLYEVCPRFRVKSSSRSYSTP